MENKKQNIYKAIMLVVITALITFLITTIALYKYGFKNVTANNIVVSNNSSDIETTLSRFKTLIDKYYLGDVDEEKMVQGAIKGYIDGLEDPYTEYMTKEEMQAFTEDTMGNFDGIGIYMVKDTENNVVKVLTPIKDSPAYKAGILPGDIISKVNDVSYTGDQLSEMANKIKGETGTKVKLEIIRDGKVIELEVTRENIKINHVESKVLSNDIGYLRLSTFDKECSNEFKQKFEELQQKNIKSLIVDLRNNGGGIVDEALSIAELMTNKDETLLITVDKNNKEVVTKAKQDKTINIPIILLVNENSASASEILAGALKDNNEAKLVGTKTYGKGVIQELLTLTDGSGIKITTNEYYTPSRNKINKIGIEPDEKVELSDDLKNQLEIEESKDTQLQRAIEMLKD